MKTINLVYPEKSDIEYKISNFPDGQQNITIGSYGFGDRALLKEQIDTPIIIKSRLNNFLDLELIICATKSLRNLGVKEIHLYTPYFLGSRSDRKFEEGSTNYLKDVICPIINSLNFESVTVLDPHSDVLEACLNNFNKKSNISLISWALANIGTGYSFNEYLNNFILISPDAGASKKIYKLAEQIGYKGDVITCSKNRDIDGKLTKCIVPIGTQNLDKGGPDLIIIDDIGDRFGTFINIAKEVKEMTYNKIYLIVTHSIQEEGIKEALKYFKAIYSTNSYNDYKIKEFKQLDVF